MNEGAPFCMVLRHFDKCIQMIPDIGWRCRTDAVPRCNSYSGVIVISIRLEGMDLCRGSVVKAMCKIATKARSVDVVVMVRK